MQKRFIINNVILRFNMHLSIFFSHGIKRITKSFFFLTLIVACGYPSYAGTDKQYQTKAKRLYSFAKYTHWTVRKQVVLCVYQTNVFQGALKKAIKGKRIKKKKVKVMTITDMRQHQQCQLLFFSQKTNKSQLESLLKSVKKGVLTVGETPSFLSSGGMIMFIDLKGNFSIKQKNIRKSGLTISSQLAKLAK